MHSVKKNKADYCVTIILQPLVASNFAKDRENVKRELCSNVIISFYVIVCCLYATWCSKKKKKKKFEDTEMRLQTAVRRARPPWRRHCFPRKVAAYLKPPNRNNLVKRLIQGCNNVTSEWVEPMVMRSGW